jgi:hypothetical protein
MAEPIDLTQPAASAVPVAASPSAVIAAPDPTSAPAEAAAATPPDAAAVSPDPEKPAFAPHTETPSLLAEHDKTAAEKAAKPAAEPAQPAAEAGKEPGTPAEAKPAEPTKPADAKTEAKPAEVKPEEAKPAEPVKPEPVEYKYALPETIKLDDARKGELHAALDEFRANPAEGAQRLLDMHAAQMQRFAETTLENQHKAFADTRKGWRTEVLAVGGAGHQTAMQAVARARDALVPSEMLEPRKYDDGSPRLSQFEEFLRVTGAGDHPVFARILHNADRFISEAPFTPIEIAPPPNNGRAPGDRFARLYPNTPRQRS